jgi:para-nitrobenzyl esterase
VTGTAVWRGLRFGSIPHRFAAPVLAPLHRVPTPGGEFGAAPVQPGLAPLMGDVSTSEDCLFLNIWALPGGPRPVVVYVFGGGFEGGMGSSPWLDGSSLAAATGAVVVTLNHRVGTLGWAQLAQHDGDLTAASNLGLQDVVCALRWVRDHIAAFGGDPGRVTLSGSSSGAFLSTALLAVPEAEGLFHRLAAFSGGASRIVRRDTAIEIGDAILDALGVADDPEKLLTLPTADILSAQASVIPQEIGRRNSRSPYAFGVVDDHGPGGVLTSHPLTALERGAAREIPVFLATGQHEVATLRRAGFEPASRNALEDEAREIAGPASPRVLKAYPGDPSVAREQLLSDYIYRLPAVRAARAQAAAGGRVTLVDIGAAGHERAGHGLEAAAAFARPRSERDDHLLRAYLAFLSGDEPEPGQVREVRVGRLDSSVPTYAELLEIWNGVERP